MPGMISPNWPRRFDILPVYGSTSAFFVRTIVRVPLIVSYPGAPLYGDEVIDAVEVDSLADAEAMLAGLSS